MDAHELLRRHPALAGIAEGIVDVRHTIDRDAPVDVAVSVNVNLGIESPQLALEKGGTKNWIEEAAFRRNEAGHQIDARQEMRIRNDLVARQRGLLVIERREMSRHV